ncbi:metal-dependent hydrolase [Halorussus amylolyticus]|uniref:metal-dependent hydrolase n=1 Tax=Halorussus amylolyticus TaxID=1126242 RepID=UPI00104621C5|nr:metal-dependent hydrolase [Halorussus amylolyticus]
MVDVLGHLGMALVWLAPAWYFIDERQTAGAFVAASFWFGMLPDVDLYLSQWFAGIHHHGIFHTVVAVTATAVVVGPLLGWVFAELDDRTEWFSTRGVKNAYALGVIAVWVTGVAHLFADMLSAPDVSTRIEPLWPLVKGPIVYMDVLWYQSWWATWGLFILGVAVNVGAWYWKRESDDSSASLTASE